MIYLNEGFVDKFIKLHNEVRMGIADLEEVENMIFNVYKEEKLYVKIEENDIEWKRLQDMEKYMNKHGIYYTAKAE
ncbi:hypothetical protein [Cytobacillus sp. NCCP-133]|uniref:hypothetical protein n=1 Tax=Cytobacillus sp. NCCP-133 TaxID=766848 RepID=UPI0022318002|nr:hypothetical protein [Cytobacillus sp. NCCP-133]GLB58654.1 hypothetical protein NCCP133_07870 [Cytobacillus sp. NCCP-133]